MLEIRDLSKRYPGAAGRGSPPVAALDGVSLSIVGGEFVAVQGPSGCGKSTLLLAAGGLLAPTGGHVTFQGQDIYGMSPDARARWRAQQIGFVFQQFHLIPYLSVLDNIMAPALAWRLPDGRRRAVELLDRIRPGRSVASRAGHAEHGRTATDGAGSGAAPAAATAVVR